MFCCRAQVGLVADTLSLVATGPKGTYVDSAEIKQPRLKCVTIFLLCMYGILMPFAAVMVSWRIGMHIDLEIGTELLSYAFDVGCRLYLEELLLLRRRQNVREDL